MPNHTKQSKGGQINNLSEHSGNCSRYGEEPASVDGSVRYLQVWKGGLAYHGRIMPSAMGLEKNTLQFATFRTFFVFTGKLYSCRSVPTDIFM